MDHDSPMEQQVCVDILSNEEGSLDLGCVDMDQPKPKSGTSVDEEENIKEKRKKASSAKKPPRPHRGFSLDAADHKLIKELAAIKRARIERMKALMQKKASKSANYSSLLAVIFTIVVHVTRNWFDVYARGT
ncbi:hypothetical protein L1987_00020 [Smallanthus sonchifolius]|uniref:Uncharacterized protein n=1 Tax=Smallanthus sonchifolius TaxID=185202 RepID=A0ACB9K127_9ASTR|nr:hypothetical protein L1987_00020 [Smallanthus sonchifolius]